MYRMITINNYTAPATSILEGCVQKTHDALLPELSRARAEYDPTIRHDRCKVVRTLLAALTRDNDALIAAYEPQSITA